MTVSALTPAVEYLEDGVTLAFAAPFRYLDASDLEVTRVNTDGSVATLAEGTDWSATTGDTDAGGTVTLVSSAAGPTLRIRRVTPRSQQADYTTGDTFPAESHEDALDKLTLVDQEQDVRIDDTAVRGFLVPDGESADNWPAAAARADRLAAFDGTGQPEAGPLTALVQALVTSGLSSLTLGPIAAVTTIAGLTAMLKATLTDGDHVQVLGHNAAGDLGGGTFRWVAGDAASADGGTIFAADEGGTGRWRRVIFGPPFIEWFGYKADGLVGTAAANTTAIQNCINWASKNEHYEFRCGPGHGYYNEVYLYYDAALNPGFDTIASPQRDGKFRIVGAGNLTVTDMRTYNPGYGTVLEALGDGLVVSRVAGSPFPARKLELAHLTLVANKSGQYVVEAANCPFMELDHASILQRHTAGHGILAKNTWGLKLTASLIQGQGRSGVVTGDGIVSGIAAGTAAGGLASINSVIDGFRDNFSWVSGTWDVMLFINTWFQSSWRYNLNFQADIVNVLILEGCHFEGTDRTADIKGNSSIRHLAMRDCYNLMGDAAGVSHISDVSIDLTSIETFTIDGLHAFRPATGFMRVTGATTGNHSGKVRRSSFIHDAIGAVTGPVYLFAGVRPDFEDVLWTGIGSGLEAAATLRLYDTTTGDPPLAFQDKYAGTQSFLQLALGRPTILTGVSGTTNLGTTRGTAFDITNTAASSALLPDTPTTTDGRVFFIKNNAASAGLINVKRASDSALIKALNAGESGLFVFSRAAGTYLALVGAA